MVLEDKKKIIGEIQGFESRDDGRSWDAFLEKKNLITNVGIDNIYNLMRGNTDGYNVGIVAVGNGSGNASKTDTIVEGEYSRYSISEQNIITVNNEEILENVINFDLNEANGTIRKLALIGHSPTTTLANYDATNPNLAGAKWVLSNYADILLPNGKVKDNTLILKFIWRIKLV